MSQILLYSMIGDKFLDAFGPKCINAHRLLNYMQIPYTLKLISISADDKTLRNSIIHTPIISYEKNTYKDIYETLSLINTLNPKKAFEKFLLSPDQLAKQTILIQWAHDSLDLTLKYFTIAVEKNSNALFKSVLKTFDDKETIDTMKREFMRQNKMLKNTIFGHLTYDGATKLLFEQLDSLETILRQSPFLLGDEVSLTDFSVFGFIHFLFHPDIHETHNSHDRYQRLIQWANRIDQLSKGSYTKAFNAQVIPLSDPKSNFLDLH